VILESFQKLEALFNYLRVSPSLKSMEERFMKHCLKVALIVVVSMLAAFSLAACNNGPNAAAGPSGLTELTIAFLVDEGNPDSGMVFEDFRLGLEEFIGVPVTAIEGATHIVGIEAMRAGNLDIMWGSPFVYLLASGVMEVERLAVTENPASINKTIFITNNDEIQGFEDLRGRSFAFITAGSASGFLYPMFHLMNEFGLDRDEILAGSLFSSVTFSGGQDASIMGTVFGDFDAAAVGNLGLQSMLASGVIDEGSVRVIGSSEIIPFPGYIAGMHLPEDIRGKVREFLIAYENEEYFAVRFRDGNTRYVLPNEQNILHLKEMVEALEIDLENQ